MSDIKAKAEELGIKIDGRWSDERIQQEIDKSLASSPQPFGGKGDHDGDGKPGGDIRASKMVAVRIKRDIWDAEGERHPAGTVIDMTAEEAMDAIEAGTVSRVKG